ncbi:hypothetical protein BU26DRAFT_320565 [Trematosphaeria pertusa]|uniref:Apple domain-containing protein n=1 Tax=Trematosphaeria pertusa TaxID=390896 RepID=A0A6A6ICK7_9PLEO|nr:uncharacterized protein BU26DRAFT_320565 [Trematosphaeria pertusa]KAF2247798.1 hypothetical protein BU26DRAFT_320565 [Trematosphaeria pertusa]
MGIFMAHPTWHENSSNRPFVTHYHDRRGTGRSIDVYGRDFQVSQVASLDECAATCTNTTGCVGSHFDGKSCYMAGALPPNSNTSVDEVIRTLGIAPLPTLWSCGDNLDTYCTSGGHEANTGCVTPDNFTIRCSSSFLGNDMADGVHTKVQFSVCLEMCHARKGCIAVSFKPENATSVGSCYLKDSLHLGFETADVMGAYLSTGSSGQLIAD